jgi:hypothetical protein
MDAKPGANAIRIIGTWYVRSWIVLTWSALMLSIGIVVTLAACVVAIGQQTGLPVAKTLERNLIKG